MKIKINIVNAFTEMSFKGNSAAVIITEEWLSKDLMQLIAAENNLSQTAYIIKSGHNDYQIRWFSPFTEINFCGHATLASAFVIFSKNSEVNKINIFAKSIGRISIHKKDNGYIQMSFPNRKPSPIEKVPNELLEGLSLEPERFLLNNQAYFAVYKKEADIFNVRQNNDYLEKLAPYDVVVTAKSEKYDFTSRYFWQGHGGGEDPVTGSIHTGLAPFWSEQLKKNQLIAYQASKRGGILACRVTDSEVFISGKAVHYLEGHISV